MTYYSNVAALANRLVAVGANGLVLLVLNRPWKLAWQHIEGNPGLIQSNLSTEQEARLREAFGEAPVGAQAASVGAGSPTA